MGGLNVRWLINLGLLLVPIAATLGILLGLQTHRHATGKPPLFVDNGIKEKEYCQQFFGIEVESKGQAYTLNPNQWGWEEGDDGHLCVDVTTFNNKTYATRTTAPEFSVTWEYPPGPETAPVHAFPNIKVDGGVFPTTLESISQLNFTVEWTYGIGNKSASTTDVDELTDHAVNTNVAIDMFLDKDKTASQDSAKAAYEIMIWFATIGPATQPLGFAEGSIATKVVEGVTFDLYFGENTQTKQDVFTWSASEVTDKFEGDLTPLLTELSSSTKDDYPSPSDYLGYFALGSEALSADTTVTLHVPVLAIDVKTETTT